MKTLYRVYECKALLGINVDDGVLYGCYMRIETTELYTDYGGVNAVKEGIEYDAVVLRGICESGVFYCDIKGSRYYSTFRKEYIVLPDSFWNFFLTGKGLGTLDSYLDKLVGTYLDKLEG